MKKLVLVFLLLLPGLIMSAKKEEEPAGIPQVQVEGLTPPRGGRALVRVTIFNKKKDKVTDDQFARDAVWALLFKGYSESASQGGRATNYKPIAGNAKAEQENPTVFPAFFDNGDYRLYVQMPQGGRKVVKVDKGFKISQELYVLVDDLRKRMEEDNVIKSLNSGW